MRRINTFDVLFHPGNPQTGELGTIVTADWLNAVQEEIAQAIEGFGGTVDPAVPNQLAQVLQAYLSSVIADPPGVVKGYGGAAAPAGYLICDGSAVSRATYPALFAAIGTTYGAGNGTTTFGLPDGRGRTLIGAGQGAGLTNRALGTKGGEEAHVLTNAEMPVHTHESQYDARTPGSIDYNGSGSEIGGMGTQYTYPTTPAGGGKAHNNMIPFLAINYIIKF